MPYKKFSRSMLLCFSSIKPFRRTNLMHYITNSSYPLIASEPPRSVFYAQGSYCS